MPAAIITREKIEKVIPGSHGLVMHVAKRMGVTYDAVYQWLNKQPDRSWFDKLVKQEQEKICDVAEDSLFDDIRKGDTKSRNFFLRTKGRDRGYVPKVESEITGVETGSATINVVIDPKNDGIKNEDGDK